MLGWLSLRGRLSLLLKALDRRGRLRGLHVQHFQGDHAVHAAMPGLEHHAHAPFAQLFHHHVVAQEGAGHHAAQDGRAVFLGILLGGRLVEHLVRRHGRGRGRGGGGCRRSHGLVPGFLGRDSPGGWGTAL